MHGVFEELLLPAKQNDTVHSQIQRQWAPGSFRKCGRHFTKFILIGFGLWPRMQQHIKREESDIKCHKSVECDVIILLLIAPLI